ncbi:hypothetical protein Tco_0842977 [Tanacetum coccineum]|uniref:Uncharacterized protein n=1 Tax=Tanacetum coccineum TaxID=301880 RepID=A0ABQ5B1A9_9ASTR
MLLRQKTLANGIQELVASIDNKEYTITEASVRSKLQLADVTGITNLPDADIYVGLATLGYVSEGKLTFWKNNLTPQWKFLIHHILHCLSPKSGGWDQFGSSIATALIYLSSNRLYNFSKLIFDGMVQHQIKDTKIPQSQGPTITLVPDEVTTTRVGVNTEGATTTTTGLDAGLDSGNINESPLRSYDIPLHDVNMSRSLEDSLKVKELSLLVPKLELKIGSLEKELKDTRKTFGNAILTLVDRVKSLNCLKINQRDFVTPTKTRVSASVEAQEEDISPTTLEAAKTLSKVASQKARLTDKGRRYKRRKMSKGKDISAGLDAKVHLDEMVAKRVQEEVELTNQQAQRMAQVQEAAQYYIEEDWDTIRAKLEANTELTKSLKGESVTDDDFAKRMVEMINQKKKYYAEQKAKAKRGKPMTQAQQKDYISTFIKNQSTWKLAQLKKLTFEELKTEFEKLVKSIESFVPMGSEERVKRQEEKGDEPMKKRGKRKKQIARKGIHIDKTAQDETEEEKEAFMKEKVTSASSESEIGIDAIPTATKPPSIVD